MAYEIYITDALVCGSRDNNTSDRSYLLFTREAGMVWASVKSAREERSKHRYALQEFSLARVSLVRGKSGWRVTGAESDSNVYFSAPDRETRMFIRDTVRLLRRFLQGETPAPALFDDVRKALFAQGTDPAKLHLVCTFRTLHTLGYVSPRPSLRPLIEATTVLDACAKLNEAQERESRDAIEHAFSVSHL